MTFRSLNYPRFAVYFNALIVCVSFLVVGIESTSTPAINEQIDQPPLPFEDGKCKRDQFVICEPVTECSHHFYCGSSEFCCEGICVLKPSEGEEKCYLYVKLWITAVPAVGLIIIGLFLFLILHKCKRKICCCTRHHQLEEEANQERTSCNLCCSRSCVAGFIRSFATTGQTSSGTQEASLSQMNIGEENPNQQLQPDDPPELFFKPHLPKYWASTRDEIIHETVSQENRNEQNGTNASVSCTVASIQPICEEENNPLSLPPPPPPPYSLPGCIAATSQEDSTNNPPEDSTDSPPDYSTATSSTIVDSNEQDSDKDI